VELVEDLEECRALLLSSGPGGVGQRFDRDQVAEHADLKSVRELLRGFGR
jgi:hypothetical protein